MPTSPEAEPRLSILIVSHGHAAMVARCLDSLGGIDIDHEVVVLDNLVEPDFHKRIGGSRSGLTVLTNDRPAGFAANMNRAAAAARGRTLLILNPDTEYRSGSVAAALEYLDAHPEIGVLAGRLIEPDGAEQRNFRRFPSLPLVILRGLGIECAPWKPGFYRRAMMEDVTLCGPLDVDWVYGSLMLIERDLLTAMGGFDTGYFMYYEDVDLCYRMYRQGRVCRVWPDLVFMHIHLRSSAKRPFGWLWLTHLRSAWRYARKCGAFLRAPGSA